MLSAVIFDFDGVIADIEPLHYRALRVLAVTHSFARPQLADFDAIADSLEKISLQSLEKLKFANPC